MSDYIITVNSTVDTTREWLAERGVPYIPLKYTIDGQTYSDMEGLSSKEFFDKCRFGSIKPPPRPAGTAAAPYCLHPNRVRCSLSAPAPVLPRMILL